MGYLVGQVLLCLFVAALLGFLIGYLLQGLPYRRRIEDLESRLQGWEGELNPLKQSVSELPARISHTENEIHTGMQKFQIQISEMVKEQNPDDRLSAMSGRIDTLLEDMAKLRDGGGVRERFIEVESALASLQERYQTEFNSRITQLAEDLLTLRSEVRSASESFQNLNEARERLNKLETRYREDILERKMVLRVEENRQFLSTLHQEVKRLGEDESFAHLKENLLNRMGHLESLLHKEFTENQVGERLGEANNRLGQLEERFQREFLNKNMDNRLDAHYRLINELNSRLDGLPGTANLNAVFEDFNKRFEVNREIFENMIEERDRRIAMLEKQLADLSGSSRLGELEAIVAELKREPLPEPVATEGVTPPQTPADEDEYDDLKRIKGVAKVLEKRLHELGVRTFRQIANFSEKDIDFVSGNIGAFRNRIRRDDWRAQARALYAEKYGRQLS
ncbi:MAG TPA: hypothetical protein PKV71_10675 [Calditrichia bacterium]|nr:hypothetical protein [Calditrichota bacterium]HQU70734.1 hypothetical protein [Calditrichia bacterium]HQV32333.1 hypothetical protein [Calditrichia bacterium]